MLIRDEKGIALVLALILLVVLSILAVAMVFLGRYETGFLVKERLSDSALYIADGGIEYGINELQKSTGYQGTSEPCPLGNVGQFTVSVSTDGQPANHYEITSTGFVPDADNPRETRTVTSLVNIIPGTPPYAVGAKQGITIAPNVTVKGDLRSDGQIKLHNSVRIEPSEPGASDGSIYTSTGMASGVWIENNLYMQRGREIKSRGPTNEEKGGDTEETGIWDEAKIKSGDPYICEGDTSSDTDPISDYRSVDLVELDKMEKVVYDEFMEISSATFHLDGKVHKFTRGVRFNQSTTFYEQGVIWVSSGTGTYGIELCQNAHGPGGENDPADVNLIVSGGTWDTDIMIRQNAEINGLVSGTTKVSANSRVEIYGVIESGGTIVLDQNVTIKWGEFGFAVPTKGSPATTIVKSWREL